ncbi:hypothetical protein NDU88_001128 [Pleurodeles waltl]|uniref:Uncharacterized protein n=1 Tax=Pleurodeles waltl TaxID=8319 RepID=A0AAV7VVH8_PLEWA|nr:hypothetical protein NDU88_001128 [Pleurodeles waltl]
MCRPEGVDLAGSTRTGRRLREEKPGVSGELGRRPQQKRRAGQGPGGVLPPPSEMGGGGGVRACHPRHAGVEAAAKEGGADLEAMVSCGAPPPPGVRDDRQCESWPLKHAQRPERVRKQYRPLNPGRSAWTRREECRLGPAVSGACIVEGPVIPGRSGRGAEPPGPAK